MVLLYGEQVFLLIPVLGAYAGPYNPSTDWHNPCRAEGAGGSRPETRCSLRTMKPVLSVHAGPAKNKLGIQSYPQLLTSRKSTNGCVPL